jgi:hypothetical protein
MKPRAIDMAGLAAIDHFTTYPPTIPTRPTRPTLYTQRLSAAPASDPRNPLAGVFATRSPDRPNPLGLHPVTIHAIDVKPVLGASDSR